QPQRRGEGYGAGRRERRRVGQRQTRRRRRTLVYVQGRIEGSGLADQTRQIRAGQEISDGLVDSRRAVVNVFRRLELGLPELRGPPLRGALHTPARLDRES